MSNTVRCALLAAVVLAGAAEAAAATTVGRVYLLDGTTIACAGEYARVDNRIVFSLPLGVEPDGQPRLELVSLPAERVDWTRTERYREAVRAARYAETSGERDFTAMTAEVAQTLNDIAFTSDPSRKLALAQEARRRLLTWPAAHFGYRANEVREIVNLLDEAVSDLRASAGAQEFDLDLVAMVVPEQAPLLAAPTAGEIVSQALAAAEVTDVTAERITLLSAVIRYLDDPRVAGVSKAARKAAKSFAERRLEEERRADRDYDRFAQELLAQSATRVSRADVAGVERLATTVDRKDASLGRRRPDRIRSLMTALNDDLATARRLRLTRDQWTMRVSSYRSYSRLVRSPLIALDLMRSGLEDIKRLAGPDSSRLSRLAELSERAARDLHLVIPPSDLAPVHSLLQSACEMGRSAVRIRVEAVKSGSMPVAWNASAAAAGSLMLVAQARDELARYLAPPAAR